jgi:hypothetical protein
MSQTRNEAAASQDGWAWRGEARDQVGWSARTVMAGTFASDEASGPPWSTFLAGAPPDKVLKALECGVTASPPIPTVAMFKSAAGERANVSWTTLRSRTRDSSLRQVSQERGAQCLRAQASGVCAGGGLLQCSEIWCGHMGA